MRAARGQNEDCHAVAFGWPESFVACGDDIMQLWAKRGGLYLDKGISISLCCSLALVALQLGCFCGIF